MVANMIFRRGAIEIEADNLAQINGSAFVALVQNSELR